MRITPLDIRKHSFPRRMRGYDPDEVDAFLRMVAEDFEGLLREAERLRKHVVKLETRVGDLSANESVLQETLTTAQRLGEDLKRTAAREAEVQVSEAEIKAEKILGAAHRRAAKLTEDIREMKLLKTRLAAAVRATIETHLGLLEGLEAEPGPDGETEPRLAHLVRSRGERKPPQGA
jgi:cell division initiation protein